MNITEAKKTIGSLGFPTKMPGTSYGLPAKACKTGSKLAKISGSVCHGCYALKGQYMISNTVKGHQRRLEAIRNPRWVLAMVTMLRHVHHKPYITIDLGQRGVRAQRKGGSRTRRNDTGWHRWHDSGDLQSVQHLAKICLVADLTRRVQHWLPTQELAIVREYVSGGGFIPPNLIIRVSAAMVNGRLRNWQYGSSVFTGEPPADAWVCPASKQGNECKTCRACWSTIEHVAYPLH